MPDDIKQIHEIALKRFESVEDKERDQRALAVEDLKFAQTEDGQWDDDAVTKRKGRPRYTINRVAGAIDQLIGDQRQNRTAIKIRPVSGGATEDIANTYTGLIKNIETQSKAENAYDHAFDEVVNGGYGGWRVITQFNDDDSFEQDIRIKPIQGATTSLWFDPGAKEYDKRDAMWAFLTVWMAKDEYKLKYPDSQGANWDQEKYSRTWCRSWFEDDRVRVAEYWVKTPITKEIGLLSDGRVIDVKEEAEALGELAAQGITVVKTRSVKSHKIQVYVLDGNGVLEGPKDWAGKYIPLIPVYGRQSFIEGQEYTRGIVRFAKDSNRIYNYTTSAMVETSALTPKDPYWYTPAQVKGHEDKYRNFNTQNSPFMPYNPDPSNPGPPQRSGAPAVQGAFVNQIQQASMDLYHVTGMQPPSLGANPELKSGKAIQAQERLGDRGSYIFTDNLSKSIEYTGEILTDLIPRIYDTQRQIRVMQQDGESEMVLINETVVDPLSGKKTIINDLSHGKYDVVAETGPAFATQRQESAQQILELIATSPMFEQLAMDLVAKDLPILESKELTKRVRKQMIMQGVVIPTQDEIEEYGLDQPQEPDPAQQALEDNVRMQTEKLMSDIEKQDAETQSTIVKTQQATIDAYKDLIDSLTKKLESGMPLNASDRDIMIKQQDIVSEGQQVLDPGPNSEARAEIVQNLPRQ